MSKHFPLRVVRAVVGVFAMIMLKACTQPAVALLAGESEAVGTLSWRGALAFLGFVLFVRLRDLINQSHSVVAGSSSPLLRSVWSL
jgi:hypothetical protein